ncbi:MAG: hypothetical protein M3Q24_00130 [bacterium]|nr:hypothetical protein [bacterium]
MDKTIIGVFGSRNHAEMAITDLRALGIADADLSYIYVSEEGKTVTEDGAGGDVASGAAAGATTGAVVGALAGLVVANGVLPGLGTLFVAGPLAAALGLTGAAATTAAGAMTGAAAGGFVGALTGLGVDETEAKVYEERVRSGGILVTARTTDAGSTRAVFANHGAEEIREYARS